MTIRQRWIAWQIVVVGTLMPDADVAWDGSIVASIVGTAMLIAMLGLLLTTPKDAIVLSRDRSEQLLSLGALVIYAIAWWPGGSITTAIGAVVIDIALLALCRRVNASAWWAALFAWQPMLLVAIRSS